MLRTLESSRLTLTRSFSQTPKAQGFMDWFNQKKAEEKKKIEKPEDLNKVISKAENDEIVVKRLDKIEFIGKKVPERELLTKEERLNGFEITKWLNDEKITNNEEFKSLILSTYNELTKTKVENLKDVVLDDLALRFELTKEVQSKSGYIIPDYILTKAFNGEELQHYFDTKLVNGDYLIKNKHILPVETLSFESPNISIKSNVTSKERKTAFKKLLKEAKQDQAAKAEKLIEESRA